LCWYFPLILSQLEYLRSKNVWFEINRFVDLCCGNPPWVNLIPLRLFFYLLLIWIKQLYFWLQKLVLRRRSNYFYISSWWLISDNFFELRKFCWIFIVWWSWRNNYNNWFFLIICFCENFPLLLGAFFIMFFLLWWNILSLWFNNLRNLWQLLYYYKHRYSDIFLQNNNKP
jgi:hypothetical protein